MIDHLLKFTTEAAAQADAVVGAYWKPPDAVRGVGGYWRDDVCIRAPHLVGPSAVGFYIYICITGDAALDTHPNLVAFSTVSTAYPLFMGRPLATVKASAA